MGWGRAWHWDVTGCSRWQHVRACSWAAQLGGGTHSCTHACKSVYPTQAQLWMQWGVLLWAWHGCTAPWGVAALADLAPP